MKDAEHEYEAGRLFDANGKLLSIVKTKVKYREVLQEDPKNEPKRGVYI